MGLKKSAPAPLHAVQPRHPARDLAGLLAQLADADAAARRWAARDLAEADAADRAAAAPALCAQLAREADASVREALFTSLARLGGEPVVAGVLPLLRSEEPALRNGAIELLAQLPDASAPHVQALLTDADADVRIFAVNLLGALPHPSVPQWIAQVLARETEPNVVGAALEVAAEVANADTLPALRALAARFPADPFIGFAAALAVERIAGA